MLALGACASGVRKPDVTLPAAYEAPAGAVALAPAALERWWLVFGDDELNTLEQQALTRSPDVKTQSARLKEAIAARDSSILQTYGAGNVTGSATRKGTQALKTPPGDLLPIGGLSETEQLDFRPSWELDWIGGLSTARAAAKADFAANRFDIENARATLVASVADSYFEARGLAIQLDDAQETQRIEQQLLDVAKLKADRGIGPQSDADRIAGDLAQAQSNVASLTAEEHVAQRLLLILVGRGPEPVESLPLAAAVPDAPPTPQAVPGELLVRRPDVREAEEKMRAATLNTKLAREQLFPNLTIQPALGIARQVSPGVGVAQTVAGFIFFPQQQTQATDYWSYGLGLSQPVLDIPRLLEDAKAQSARAEQAVVAYEKAVQTAYGDAENSLVRLSADEARVKILEDGEVSARRAYDAAKLRYERGLDDLTSALSAEQAWRADRSALTAERVQALRRAVQVYKALGGGWALEPIKTAARTP